jgi:hypothetical protein
MVLEFLYFNLGFVGIDKRTVRITHQFDLRHSLTIEGYDWIKNEVTKRLIMF